MGLRIKVEEVGEMVEYRTRTVPTHHAFVEKTLTLAMAIGDTSGLLIDEVRRNLPDTIRKLITNESYANWQEFHDSMLAIRMPALAEAKRDVDIIQQITEAIRSKDEQTHLRPGPHMTSTWHTQRATTTPAQVPTTPNAARQIAQTPGTRVTTRDMPTRQTNLPGTPTRQTTTLNPFHSPTNPFMTPTHTQGQNDAPQPMYNTLLYDI
ncbi:hypothetical protein JB92DRAFT_3111117 [Gautieria morchelliformis]|nr:hypothetical protein JB92DRAFT_3111117 [Gautieria morchelliformis]